MKNFGFGCMRLPMLENGEVDEAQFSKMIEMFFANGFTYFDTAHPYIDGKSEIAIKHCLTSKYPRESYQLANKLSGGCFKTEDDILPLFNQQLECCGVEYFDYYLFHALSSRNIDHYEKCNAFKTVSDLKKQGKVKHIAMSFHDSAECLDKILTEHPEVEAVQLQFNYADYLSPAIQSKACYEVARKHNKPVIVMEPVKGGTLVNLPEDANALFDVNRKGSNASYALRFAASFDGIFMVLSGMSNMEQMEDNCSFMKDFVPMSEEEKNLCLEVASTVGKKDKIQCTSCQYCVAGCPKRIAIPYLFSAYNENVAFGGWAPKMLYAGATAEGRGKASDCIKCGKCENICPQMLPIRSLLEKVSSIFDKTEEK